MRILSLIVAIVLFSLPINAAELVLKRVQLSTGGVGQFEYEAMVNGNDTLLLSIPLNQIDDVLKSITVCTDEGAVKSVSLAGKQPLSEMFKNLPFEQSSLNSLDRLLNDLQGAMISVKGQKRLKGQVINVSAEEIIHQNQSTTIRHRVSLMTDKGIRQFILENAEEVKFADKKLNAQIQNALTEITQNKAKDARTLTIKLEGKTKRKVRVSYIVEAPLWKTSYRIIAADDDKDKLLQGWALLENMSGQDWNEIELSLVSGNPVTFKQSLYTSYYVPRQEVPVSIGGRVMPKVDDGSMTWGGAVAKPMVARLKSNRKGDYEMNNEMDVIFRNDNKIMASRQSTPMPAPVTTEKASASVIFKFPKKISVKAGHSVSLRLLNNTVPMERVALYQPSTHPTHPLAAVEVTNTYKTALPQGVLTMYELGKMGLHYVGDAQLANFPEGEKRLLSFAVDNDITIDKKTKFVEKIYEGKISKGIFYAKKKQRETTVYMVKAPEKEQSLIIEHPRKRGWEVVSPKDYEITKNNYRIKHTVAGQEQFSVVSERLIDEKVSLLNLTSDRLYYYVKEGELSKETKQAFRKIAGFMEKKIKLEKQIRTLESKKRSIVSGQARIRENLRGVSSSNSLRNRYLQKLEKQEDEIERIERDIDKYTAQKQELEEKLGTYIETL